MLFRKRIEKSCTYCRHSTKVNEEECLCMKKGIVPLDHKCRKFTYDPCKRVPSKAKALNFEKYNDEDFSL